MNLIETFEQKLKNENIKAYIVPTSDYHQSEYISDYFKTRAYLSGFTGSAGTLVITDSDARLWTDGRYFLQAEKELDGKSVSLMRMGQKNIPTIFEFLDNALKDGDTIAFDPKVVSTNFVKEMVKSFKGKNVNFCTNLDFIDLLWPNRPQLPKDKIYLLANFFAGKTYQEKLNEVRKKLASLKVTDFLLTALEDIAWLLNLRGNDVLYTPVFLSYLYITDKEVTLYVDKSKLGFDAVEYLNENNIKVKDYYAIYSDVKKINNRTVLIDPDKVNYELYQSLKANNAIVLNQNPTLALKAIKNEIEIKNTKLAHIKDGVAVTKFIYYVKHNYKKDGLTELKASDYLLKCREEQKGFLEPSFNTICGFKANASMLHYSATLETDTDINGDGLLLVDSGGQYLEGTTDITRTIAIGNISEEERKHFTTVLKSVIALSKAVFLEGCTGLNLDILARGPIWNLLLDYRCGTGHGVGHILSVHEGPNGFRWKKVSERNDSAILENGMITTNEPGIYIDNKYGIRIENEMLCVSKGESEYGKFLGFETLTLCPIDLDAIDENLLTKDEKEWLNNYHQTVFNTLKEYIKEEEILQWLTFVTRRI